MNQPLPAGILVGVCISLDSKKLLLENFKTSKGEGV